MAGYSRDPLVHREDWDERSAREWVERFINALGPPREPELTVLTEQEWKRLDFLAYRIGKGEVVE